MSRVIAEILSYRSYRILSILRNLPNRNHHWPAWFQQRTETTTWPDGLGLLIRANRLGSILHPQAAAPASNWQNLGGPLCWFLSIRQNILLRNELEAAGLSKSPRVKHFLLLSGGSLFLLHSLQHLEHFGSWTVNKSAKTQAKQPGSMELILAAAGYGLPPEEKALKGAASTGKVKKPQ